MAVLYFTGFESGAGQEMSVAGTGVPQTTIVHTGRYAWLNTGVANTAVTGALSTTALAARFYVYFTAYSAATAKACFQFTAAGPTVIFEAALQLASPGTLAILATGGFSATNGSTVVTLNRWHRIDVAFDSANGGVGRVWLDGNLEVDITHTGSTGTVTIARINSNGSATYHDDVLIQDGTTRPPDGRVIARQGVSTTPTDDAWTKSTGSTINTVWNQTPFTTTLNANTGSTTSARAQTMFTQSLTVENGTYGPGHLSPSDTINACKTAIIGNTSNTAGSPPGTTGSVRRRLNGGAATDTAYPNFSTTTRWMEGSHFTDTLSNLNLMEFGANKGVTGLAVTHTIYAAYIMCDYTEASKLQTHNVGGKLFSLSGGTGALQIKP